MNLSLFIFTPNNLVYFYFIFFIFAKNTNPLLL